MPQFMGSQRVGHDRVTEQQNVKRTLTVFVIKRMSIKVAIGTNKCTNTHSSEWLKWDFPGDPMVKNPPADAGNMGLIPDPGRFHMSRGN